MSERIKGEQSVNTLRKDLKTLTLYEEEIYGLRKRTDIMQALEIFKRDLEWDIKTERKP